MRSTHHLEHHLIGRVPWLRAAVLGANDGIVSMASLITGIAASNASHADIMIAGIAGIVAGAMSMAAGEYVSVSSQSDTEKADIAKEAKELETNPEYEFNELVSIYVERGLDRDLAQKVATQLVEKDALKAHLRDELGITDIAQARPMQAAITSALLFSLGAGLPVSVAFFAPIETIIVFITISSLFFLALLGGVAAFVGGASILKGVIRVSFWGALAMLATALVGRVFGAVVI